MSDDGPREPRPLDYRSPGDEPAPASIPRTVSAAVIVIAVMWAGAFAGGVVGRSGGVVVGGFLASALVIAILLLLHGNASNHPYIAGAWVGLALGWLLVGWCAAVA